MFILASFLLSSYTYFYIMIRICSWNVNGIRAVDRKGLFQPFIDSVKPDIICLQETKANRDQVEIDFKEYQEFWNSAEKKGYSGTAIFTKIEPIQIINGLPEDLIEKYDLDSDSYGNPNKEGRVITAEFDNFYLTTVYTPNAKDDLSRLNLRHKQWDPAFLEFIKSLEKTKPVVFCGDLNVAHTEDDLSNPKPNVGKKGFTHEEREGFDSFIDAGFIDTFRINHQGNGYYSWWSHWANARARNVGWRIDYFLVSQELKKNIKDAKIHPEIMGSDHCPVSIDLDI